MALDAASMYYDNVLSKGKYPGEWNMYKNMDREDAIRKLAKTYVGKLREAIPEQGYNDNIARQVAKLDVGAVEKYMFEFGPEPFKATRDIDFGKVMDKWYGWGPKETEAQMYHFGYNPAVEGDRQKFLKELGDYQMANDRAKIVQETIGDAGLGTKLAFAAYPAMTKEATRQSLTGDFDDSKMNRATVADILANGTMAVAPSFKVLSTPVAAGAVAGGAEAARQVIQPTEGSFSDVALAATTAGTVPGIGQYIQGTVSRGASTGARQVAREFSRGLRGADDPLMQERNALKKLLIDARKKSVDASNKPTATGLDFYPSEATIPELAEARKWGDAEAKLNALGFNTEREYNAVAASLRQAENDLQAAKAAEREAILAKPKSRKKVDKVDYEKNIELKEQIRAEAQKNYEDAVTAMDELDNRSTITAYGDEGWAEDVIGMNPADIHAGPVTVYRAPAKGGVEAALKAYDRPMVFGGGVQRSPALGRESLQSFTNMENKYKAAFPEMYQQQLFYGKKNANTKLLKNARLAGRVISGVGTRVEPTTGSLATVLTGGNIGDKVRKFKESEWYQNLPKEKKNIIEKVLKGE